MQEFVSKNYKKLEIVASVAALLVFLVGNAIEEPGRVARVIPYIILLVASFISNYSKKNTRVLVWILMGVELFCTISSGIGIYYFYPYMVREILDAMMFYETTVTFIIWFQILLMILMPFLRRGGIVFYSAGMCVLYLMAAILEGGLSITLIGGVLYYVALMSFARELKPDNKLKVYSRLWDYFIEESVDENEDEDFFPGFDDILEDDDEEEFVPRRSGLLEKFLQMMEEEVYEGGPGKLRAKLQKAVDMQKKELVIKGADFLLDDYEESELAYKMEYEGEVVRMSATYSYHFLEKDASTMLKKKSVLNQTFEDIGFSGRANAELDIEDLSEGVFAICLPKCEFALEESEKLVDAMFDFMKTIILLNNAKIY